MEETAKYYHRQQSISAILDEVELDELLIAGVGAVYDAQDEQYRVLHAVAQMLEKRQMDYAATGIRKHIERNKAECLAAGVCPFCGEDVTVERLTEHHDENRLGSAPERLTRYVCSGTCGEV